MTASGALTGRGALAQAVYDNPVFQESFTAVKKLLVMQMLDAKEPATILDLHRKVAALEDVQRIIIDEINSGLLAQQQMDFEEQESRRYDDMLTQFRGTYAS